SKKNFRNPRSTQEVRKRTPAVSLSGGVRKRTSEILAQRRKFGKELLSYTIWGKFGKELQKSPLKAGSSEKNSYRKSFRGKFGDELQKYQLNVGSSKKNSYSKPFGGKCWKTGRLRFNTKRGGKLVGFQNQSLFAIFYTKYK
ncbi:hypothetical protein V8G54_011296, partial [Vigna mungo]